MQITAKQETETKLGICFTGVLLVLNAGQPGLPTVSKESFEMKLP